MVSFWMLVFSVVFGCGAAKAVDTGRTRIVVVPFYTEAGQGASNASFGGNHCRRMMRFINNRLVAGGFEVLNPFAVEAGEQDYNRLIERTREDSPLAGREMCRKYGSDAAYVVWLKVRTGQTADGYCRAAGRLDGEGYDSGGRDLGVGVSKTFKVTRRDCDDAVAEVEKQVGDEVGRTLTAWDSGNHGQDKAAAGSGGKEGNGGVLQKHINAMAGMVNLRLEGATGYELSEVFGKVVNTVTGVTEAKRYRSRIVPDNPQGSYVLWRVRMEGTDPFRLQANIMKMIHDVLKSGGTLKLKGVPYRYTPEEIRLLRGLRPGDTTTNEIQFVIDRELARTRLISGRFSSRPAR